MRKRSNRDAAAPAPRAGEPEDFGWRRRAELDADGREAWQLRDGAIMLLDPSGLSDALIRSDLDRDGNEKPEKAGIAGPRRALG